MAHTLKTGSKITSKIVGLGVLGVVVAVASGSKLTSLRILIRKKIQVTG